MYSVSLLVASALASVALAAVAATTDTTADAPPFHYRYNMQVGKYYKLHQWPESLHAAREICRRDGAVVAYPGTPAEREALEAIRGNATEEYIWLGAHAAYAWRVTDDEPYQSLETEAELLEAPIGMLLTPSGVNSFANASEEFTFLCELSEAAVCKTAGYAPGIDGSSCYKLHQEEKIWVDALLACEAEGAHLAIVNSEKEAEHLSSLVSLPELSSKDVVAVGFHDLFREGEFITIDGRPLASSGYESWGAGQPDNAYAEGENCGTIQRITGRLNDYGCHRPTPFICEKEVKLSAATRECVDPDITDNTVTQI